MDQVCGRVPKETHSSASGSLGKQMDTECIHGSIVTDMKANSRNPSNMEKAYRDSLMEISTKDSMDMGNPLDSENTIG